MRRLVGVRQIARNLRHGRCRYPDTDHPRPRTRAQCEHGPRPCPYVGCRYHLYLDVTAAGSLRYTWPGREPSEVHHSCALDLADEGVHTLEAVGEVLGLTRERVRQIETGALRTLASTDLRHWEED